MSRVRRRRLAAIAVAVLLVLSACGGEEEPGGSAVEFWYYQPTPEQSQKVKELANRFQKENQGTRIRLTEIPKDDYDTKLATALTGDRVPDAGYLDQPLMPRYVRAQQILKVPEGTIRETDYYAGALNTNRIDGALYGIPLQQTTVVLFSNKQYITTPPSTWDGLVETAARVHREHPEIAGVNVPKPDGFGAWLFPGFVASAGGGMLDEANKKVLFADPPAQEALTLWRTLLASSPRKITNSEKPFEKGLAAMMFSGPWDVLAIREQFPQIQFQLSLLPKKNVDASTIGGDNGVVFSKARNPGGAWKWLQFLADATHNAEYANITANFPTNKQAAAKSTLVTDPEFKVVLQQLDSAKPRPTVAQWPQINNEYLAKAIEEAVDLGRPPAEALATAAERARKALEWG